MHILYILHTMYVQYAFIHAYVHAYTYHYYYQSTYELQDLNSQLSKLVIAGEFGDVKSAI